MQVFYSILGPHLRKSLGYEEKFDPTCLREPYILKVERGLMEETIRHSLRTEVTAIILSARHSHNNGLSSYKLQQLVTCVLKHYESKLKDNVFLRYEVVGSMLLRTMHRGEMSIMRHIMSADNSPLESKEVITCVSIFIFPSNLFVCCDSLLSLGLLFKAVIELFSSQGRERSTMIHCWIAITAHKRA